MPRSVAIFSASRTRSSESIRPATYIVVTGTSARSASTTELRPATISLDALPPRREPPRGPADRCGRGRRRCAAALGRRLGRACGPCAWGAPRPWASGPGPRALVGAGRRSRPWRPSWTLPLRIGAAALGVACHECASQLSRRASDQFAPDAVSSMTMPAAPSWSRIASAVAKSRAARAGRAGLQLRPHEGVERRTGRRRLPASLP